MIAEKGKPSEAIGQCIGSCHHISRAVENNRLKIAYIAYGNFSASVYDIGTTGKIPLPDRRLIDPPGLPRLGCRGLANIRARVKTEARKAQVYLWSEMFPGRGDRGA